MVGCQGLGAGGMGCDSFMWTGFSFEVIKMFWNAVETVSVQQCEYAKCHGIVRFKMVRFTLCGFAIITE